jgi:hypothetical protein
MPVGVLRLRLSFALLSSVLAQDDNPLRVSMAAGTGAPFSRQAARGLEIELQELKYKYFASVVDFPCRPRL